MEEPFGIRITAALIASRRATAALRPTGDGRAAAVPKMISPPLAKGRVREGIRAAQRPSPFHELPHLIANLGVMMCSNAVSVSSPGGGRGWFWECRPGRKNNEVQRDAVTYAQTAPLRCANPEVDALSSPAMPNGRCRMPGELPSVSYLPRSNQQCHRISRN